MEKNKITFVSITLATIILSSLCISMVKASNESESIDLANSSVNVAFTNIFAAQQAGANVTKLLITLKTDTTLLTQTINSYKAGKTANVTNNAEKVRSIADQVNSEALSLKNDSITRLQNNLLLTCLFSISAISIFVALLLLFWRRFKRSYMKKILELKPVDIENAS